MLLAHQAGICLVMQIVFTGAILQISLLPVVGCLGAGEALITVLSAVTELQHLPLVPSLVLPAVVDRVLLVLGVLVVHEVPSARKLLKDCTNQMMLL